jgi:hypothetical protein
MDDDGTFSSEPLPPPDFFNFANIVPEAIMLYSTAAFFRNSGNSNIELAIPIGPDISPGTIWLSPNTFLIDDTFNFTKPITEIIYPNNKDTRILKDLKFLHDVLIQYKLTKSNNTNFTNQRELRCIFVREDGMTPYDSSLCAYQQPDSGQHDNILLRGHVEHKLGDLVRLKINIVQDSTFGDQTDSKLTIFRINWNILGLSTSEPL